MGIDRLGGGGGWAPHNLHLKKKKSFQFFFCIFHYSLIYGSMIIAKLAQLVKSLL